MNCLYISTWSYKSSDWNFLSEFRYWKSNYFQMITLTEKVWFVFVFVFECALYWGVCVCVSIYHRLHFPLNSIVMLPKNKLPRKLSFESKHICTTFAETHKKRFGRLFIQNYTKAKCNWMRAGDISNFIFIWKWFHQFDLCVCVCIDKVEEKTQL